LRSTVFAASEPIGIEHQVIEIIDVVDPGAVGCRRSARTSPRSKKL
jgi:hypothetical protein